MAKFCINCGEAVSEDAKFCPSCGAKIGTVIKKEDSLPGLGTLLLRRAHEYDYKNYSAPVYVDGDQIGEIYDSGELRIKLEDGDHQINVSVREKTIGSKTVHISGNKTTSAIVSVSGGIEVQETVSDAGSAPQQTDYARLYGTPSQRTVKKKTKKKWTGLKTLVIVLGVFMVLSIISHLNDGDSTAKTTTTQEVTITPEEYKAMCTDVTYENVARNPENYKGKYVKFSGEVIQVSDGSTVTLRINQTNPDKAYSSDTWYVTYKASEGEGRILEGDSIIAYGECTGTKTYRAIFGNSVTIPSLKMQYYELAEQ